MILVSLSELENLLVSLRDYAEKYRVNRQVLEAVEDRWLKFQELAFAFGVELKPAEGVELYAGGPLADNSDFIRRLDRTISTIRRLREIYGDVKAIIDIDLSVKKITIKI